MTPSRSFGVGYRPKSPVSLYSKASTKRPARGVRSLVLLLCVATAFPLAALRANNFSDRTEKIISEKTIRVSQAVLDAGRVRKQVTFRGNKSARFAEFENLALAPQQLYAKRLLNSAVAIDDSGVVNYAQLPDMNVAQAVEKVETKVTQRAPRNPAIAGYGRAKRDLYGALRAKRAQDARDNQALMAKLDQFQVKAGRMQEKLQRANSESLLVAALQ